MKRLLIIVFTLGIFLVQSNVFAFSMFNKKEKKAQPVQEEQTLEEIELNLNEESKLKIEKNEPVKKLESQNLTLTEQEQIQAFKLQQKQDVEDITKLWEATLERNNVIKFALRKVTMNPEERKKHSSKMARSVAALVNGATFLPYIFGLDASIASAVAAGTSLVTQAGQNKLGYGMNNIPITDTELIQLASLLEELQNSLIRNYYEYKSAIELLKDCRAKLAIHKKNYDIAQAKKDEANILVTQSMYEKQKMEELKLKNRIKSARLELERYAGEEVVNDLNLAKVNEIKALLDDNRSNL